MARAIQNLDLRGALSAAFVMCLARTALGYYLLGLMGCAVQEYSPPLLPTFMREQIPAGVTPPVGQDDPYKPPARDSRGVPTQPAPVPPKPKSPGPSAGIASAGDASQSGESSSPQPTADRSRGLTLEQAIQTPLDADQKSQAGLEAINHATADFLTA